MDELTLLNLPSLPRSRQEFFAWLRTGGAKPPWSAEQHRCFNKIWWWLVQEAGMA
jgi:hypothetical protein